MPASIVSSNLAGYPSIYFDKQAIESLHADLCFWNAATNKTVPRNSGRVIQLHSYGVYAANTTPASEGVPPAPLSINNPISTLTLAEYSDYATFSRNVELTALADLMSETAIEMGYRSQLSIDKIISTTADTYATATAATQIDLGIGVYVSAETVRQAAASLNNVNAMKFKNGRFYAVVSPLVAYDIINDPSSAGAADLTKYTAANANQNLAGNPNNYVTTVGGVELYSSTAVPTYSNYSSGGTLGQGSFFFGRDALIQSDLLLDSDQATRKDQRSAFNVTVKNFLDTPQSTDPTGMIAASAGYYFQYGVTANRPDATPTFRRVRSQTSI